MSEGFANTFATEWKKASSALGGCLGGCMPWAIGISIILIAIVAVYVIFVAIVHSIDR